MNIGLGISNSDFLLQEERNYNKFFNLQSIVGVGSLFLTIFFINNIEWNSLFYNLSLIGCNSILI